MFSPKLKKVIAGIVCLAFTVTNGSYAVEILNDGGQRQTVVERTKQYAGTLDLTEVRHKAEQAFQSSVKTGDGGVATLSGMQAKCNGFTTSSCGLACCGKQECDTICTANYMSAHGKETCTDPITTSPCGMSCCGKEDCEWICQNYRIKLNDGDKCNGYIKTPTGENCCGYDECMAKACNGKTKVVRKDDGKEVECCGEENCYDIMCDYTEKVQDVAGTVQDCCGRDDCNAKYCQNQTSVDSKVVPGKKNIACCGAADCHNKACENYTTTNTPVGQVECCGYEDCHNKECQGRTSAIDKDGNTVECCGIEQCGNISEEKTYEEPAKDACCTKIAAYSEEFTTPVTGKSCRELVSRKDCIIKESGPTESGTGQPPKWTCSVSCPESEHCTDGIRTGYQQFVWETTASGSNWNPEQCPPEATYKKGECQTICGGTTGCKTICKNICEKVTCSSDTNATKICEEYECGTAGCSCKRYKTVTPSDSGGIHVIVH